jgi:cyclic-di-GMP phosphodiesterase TipF (flagellum assembly factor)
MLEVIVLIAMAITALAFAVGLIAHSGIAQIPALIAAAALYMVMAASYLMVARSRPSGGSGARLGDFEEALEIIDKDLQRIDRLEEEISRLDLVTDRVERLDQAVSEYAAAQPIGGLSRSEHFAQEFEEIHAKIETVRADLAGEAHNQREKMTADLRMLEGLIKQLSHELIAASGVEPAAVPARSAAFVAEVAKIEPEPEPEPELEFEPEPEPEPELAAEPEPELATEPETEEETLTVIAIEEAEEVLVEAEEPLRGLGDDDLPLRGEAGEEAASLEVEPVAGEPAAPVAPEPAPAVAEKIETNPIDSREMLEIMSQAIEAGRVDLYLQPIVTLPERRPCYFEALTRIRTKTDSLILPASYLAVAESSGLMPLIDNVLLVKSVQTLRRLRPESPIKGVFCNISVKTLLDPEFFPELVEFMEENAGLSDSLIFELTQAGLMSLNEAELGALDTLVALGYGFSLDHVADLEMDFVGMRDRAFRFIKVGAKAFLDSMKSSAFSGADLKRALDDFDMKLIVEKVEDEFQVAKLLDYGVDLAQGYLLGKPKPMSPALFREIEGAAA